MLKTKELFIARIFAGPENTEKVDAVLTAARERKIGGFHRSNGGSP